MAINNRQNFFIFTDYGPEPLAIDLVRAAMLNTDYRTTLWTGAHLQMTLMQIERGDDIGLEVHDDTDQYIMIVDGNAIVTMGRARDNLNYQRPVQCGFGILVPAGTWHNLINTGNKPLKLISVYAPPEHPRGTVHPTKEIAQREGN